MSCSDDLGGDLSGEQRVWLLDLAWRSIRYGLVHGKPVPVDTGALEPALTRLQASFVTLHRHGQLRGCIGSLEAYRPLAEDIAANAYAAAFRDPRFPPVTEREADELDLQLSLLTPAEAIPFGSEADLIAQLKPGIDGLIVEEGTRRGTFLPSVWESLPEPEAFWRHLKDKAGLPADYWSDHLRVFRYRSEVIS